MNGEAVVSGGVRNLTLLALLSSAGTFACAPANTDPITENGGDSAAETSSSSSGIGDFATDARETLNRITEQYIAVEGRVLEQSDQDWKELTRLLDRTSIVVVGNLAGRSRTDIDSSANLRDSTAELLARLEARLVYSEVFAAKTSRELKAVVESRLSSVDSDVTTLETSTELPASVYRRVGAARGDIDQMVGPVAEERFEALREALADSLEALTFQIRLMCLRQRWNRRAID